VWSRRKRAKGRTNKSRQTYHRDDEKSGEPKKEAVDQKGQGTRNLANPASGGRRNGGRRLSVGTKRLSNTKGKQSPIHGLAGFKNAKVPHRGQNQYSLTKNQLERKKREMVAAGMDKEGSC